VTADLAYYSLVAVYSAMAIYTISFVAFALDLAKRSGDAQQAAARAAKAEALATATVSRSAAAGSTVVLDRPSGGSGASTAAPTGAPAKASSFERVAIAMMLLGFVVHVASVVLRGLAAGRVPWANMFEFSLTGTAIIVGVYLAVQFVVNLRFLGAYVMGLNLVLLAIGTVNYYVAVSPLPPALQSGWLVIHVFVAILGTAFFAIAAGLSAALVRAPARVSEPGARPSP